MICPNCNNECDDNLMFCNACGTKLKSFIDPSFTPTKKENNKEMFDHIISGLPSDEVDLDKYIDDSSKVTDETIVTTSTSLKEKPTVLETLDDNELSYIDEPKEPLHKQKEYTSEVDGKKTKKKNSKKKVGIVVLITIVAVVLAVVTTIAVKKSVMTKKFDIYYNQGSKYYDLENYKEARTQFINAASNAFTKDQKIRSYEMVYSSDEYIGGYDLEEIEYLEALIKLDKSNIEYYQNLIILYQNNDMNSKIDSLISTAPSNLKKELKQFDGTIPVVSVEGGTYDKPIEVELSAASDVTIYYTIDGSSVSDSANKKEYSSPIKFEEEGSYTIRALSVDKNGKSSKEMSAKYVLNFVKVKAPSVNLDSGKYTDQKKIEVTADSNCTIYYTKDGTTPTVQSTKYTKAIKMPKGDSLYYFVAVDENGVYSTVVTRAYDYTPEYNYSYDDAIDHLAGSLVSAKVLENANGEFKNGDYTYFNYIKISEIDSSSYYIISCEIMSKKGKSKSTKYYAVSCDTGECFSAKSSGDTYKLDNIE